jgi:hypothetical protein
MNRLFAGVGVLAAGAMLGGVPAACAADGVRPAAEAARFVVDDDAFLDRVEAEAARLRDAGRLVRLTALRAGRPRRGADVVTEPPGTAKLAPPDLYDRVRQGTLAIGRFYPCADCDVWHFDASAGFVVTSSGVVCTSHHVIEESDGDDLDARTYIVAADDEGRAYPVRRMLAEDRDADTCLLQVDAEGLAPLPLRAGVRAGERIYCVGHPEGYHFMFTEGMVARVFRSRERLGGSAADGGEGDAHGAEADRATRPVLCLNITAEFSPGSSGGPVVDEAGNVVGQIQSLVDILAAAPEAGEKPAPEETFAPVTGSSIRCCVAAEEILRLAKPRKGPGAVGRR